MVWALCRFDINLVKTVAPDWVTDGCGLEYNTCGNRNAVWVLGWIVNECMNWQRRGRRRWGSLSSVAWFFSSHHYKQAGVTHLVCRKALKDESPLSYLLVLAALLNILVQNYWQGTQVCVRGYLAGHSTGVDFFALCAPRYQILNEHLHHHITICVIVHYFFFVFLYYQWMEVPKYKSGCSYLVSSLLFVSMFASVIFLINYGDDPGDMVTDLWKVQKALMWPITLWI